jgi:hypothetical protein
MWSRRRPRRWWTSQRPAPPLLPERLASFVAIDRRGRLVEYASEDGREVGVLAVGRVGASSVAHDPVRGDVYLDTILGMPVCSESIDRVSVRDLASGAESSWTFPESPDEFGYHPVQIAGWDPDGRRVVLHVQHEPGAEWWIVDTQAPGDVLIRDLLAANRYPVGPMQLLPLGRTGRRAGVFVEDGQQGARLVELATPRDAEGRVILR